MAQPNYQDTSWMFARTPPVAAQPALDPRLLDPRLLEKSHRPAQGAQIDVLLKASMIIGASTSMVSLLLSALVIYLASDTAPFVWFLVPLSLAAGAIVAAVLAIMWTSKAATRAWRLEDEDRYYRLLREQIDLESRNAPAVTDPLAPPPPPPPTDSDRLRLAGYNILNFHFTTGKQATRPECETELGITQTEWNAVNRILIEMNIKGERKWLVDAADMQIALIKWQRCLDIRPDGKAWIKDKPEQPQWRLIDL